MESLSRCNTVLAYAFQNATHHLVGIGQNRLQRSLDGMNQLAHAKSLQDFLAIQSDLLREGVEQMVRDGRSLAETSLEATEKAAKAFRFDQSKSLVNAATAKWDEAASASAGRRRS